MRLCNYNLDFFNPSSGVSFHYLTPQYFDPHTHNYFECFLVTHGEGIHRINGREYMLSRCEINLIRPQDVHEFVPAKNSRMMLINVMVTPEKLKEFLNLIGEDLYRLFKEHDGHLHFRLTEEEYAVFYELLDKYLLNGKNEHQESVIGLYIFELIKLCYLKYHSSIVRTSDRNRPHYPDWLRELLDRLNDPKNFALPIEELLADTHFSRVHINRLFKQYTGENLVHYFNKIKLNYSCNLLSSTNLIILEIASRIGYSSLSHFHNLFKTNFGLTPKEYRDKFSKLPPPPPAESTGGGTGLINPGDTQRALFGVK